ncbi:MAG: hypothetical protein U1E34_00775 [Amaricoccus sp.]
MTPALDRLRRQLVEALQGHLATGRRPAIPEAGGPLWSAFLDLDATRGFHAAGPQPITFAEIEAWGRLTRTPLEPHHVAILRAMDVALLQHVAEEARKAAERSQ